jgi:hypothetical protein
MKQGKEKLVEEIELVRQQIVELSSKQDEIYTAFIEKHCLNDEGGWVFDYVFSNAGDDQEYNQYLLEKPWQ